MKTKSGHTVYIEQTRGSHDEGVKRAINDAAYKLMIETSDSLDIDELNNRLSAVADAAAAKFIDQRSIDATGQRAEWWQHDHGYMVYAA